MVTADRLTYVDGTYRDGRHSDFVWLGFDAQRSSESVPADVPETRTSQMIVPGAVPEHFESVTVDLSRAGDLTVVMAGHHTGSANPRAVPGSANRDGRTKGRRVTWRMPQASPGSYTFTARFKPRSFEPNLNTFLPESRITLSSASGVNRLVLVQHAAPAYAPPKMDAGRAHQATLRVAYPDEWVADPEYVAQGNYSWATGRAGAVREFRVRTTRPRRERTFTSASMGTGMTIPVTGTKVRPFMDFTYGPGWSVTGFLHGVVTGDAVGDFFPFDTRPGGGTLYDGDAGMFGIGMSVASVHSREKRDPRAGDPGRLEWAWDGAWAEGWSTKDEHKAPGLNREAIEPVLVQESVVYARAVGGDVDNRKGTRPVRGPRKIFEFPDAEFGFIFHGAVAPAKSAYRTRSGFTKDGRFFMQPTIRPGGYMLEGTTDGHWRDWQAAEMLSVSLFEAHPEEEPGMRRLFTLPPGTRGEIVAATTTGLIERFEVSPGRWALTATPAGFRLDALGTFRR